MTSVTVDVGLCLKMEVTDSLCVGKRMINHCFFCCFVHQRSHQGRSFASLSRLTVALTSREDSFMERGQNGRIYVPKTTVKDQCILDKKQEIR